MRRQCRQGFRPVELACVVDRITAMSHNVNSLKNLERGRWKSGQSGNPSGRPKGCVFPGDVIPGLLALHDDGVTPRYTRADLEAIVEDEGSAPVLIIASRWLLDSMADGKRWAVGRDGTLKPAGLDPIPSRVREALSDRTEGKPVVRMQIERTEPRKPAEIEGDLIKLIEDNPTMLADTRTWPSLLPQLEQGGPFLERLRPLLKIHAPVLLERADAKVTKWRRKVENCAGVSHVKALQSAAEVVDTEARVLPTN